MKGYWSDDFIGLFVMPAALWALFMVIGLIAWMLL